MKMKKVLFLSALLFLIVGCCQSSASKAENDSAVKVISVPHTGFAEYYYTKDTRANPPICTVIIVESAGGGPAVVSCENLKPYFDE